MIGLNTNIVFMFLFQATVDNLHNIIAQKEEIIERLQTLIKENGEKHSQYVRQLLNELKTLQDAVDTKDQANER